MVQTIIVALIAACSSSGLTGFVMFLIQRKDAKKDLLIGLAHDRIMSLGEQYLARGDLTKEEYENMHDYLYVPYRALGGNGTAEKMMHEVDRLPLRERFSNETA